jgi:hypothetical protein
VAMLIGAGLLVAAAVVAFALIRKPLRAAEAAAPESIRVEECLHCPMTGPALHPSDAPR